MEVSDMAPGKYDKIHIDPDHWEPERGIMGLAFEAGSNITVVRVTEADLSETVRVITEYLSRLAAAGE
jgi:hypothetical protein